MSHPSLFGLLNINKPPGVTSRKVVDHVARLVRPAKAGHAGTLDPLATGVLVVCVGAATRLIAFVQEQPKGYRAAFLLGRRSDTDDVTGEVTEVPDAPHVSREQVEALLPEFCGRIRQVPPQYSAVHVAGQRAYKLARQGKGVEIEPRTVEVYRIELLRYAWPELRLEIKCGSGTYIRSIGRDLGERLGCGAVMSELVRTRIGPFDIDSAVDLESLTRANIMAHLQPAATAVAHLPQVTCSEHDLQAISHGRVIPALSNTSLPGSTARQPATVRPDDLATHVPASHATATLVAVLSPDGQLACIAQHHPEQNGLSPRHVFTR